MPTRPARLTRVVAVTGAAAVALAVTAGTAASSEAHGRRHHDGPRPTTTNIQLLSFNDFHGNLEAPSGSGGRITTGYTEAPGTAAGTFVAKPTEVLAGGAEYLATHLAQQRIGQRDTLTVAAGDLIGASPLLSAAFHDEPTIESMNALGLDVTAVGNHEFDEGYRELQRMDRGGCLPDVDGKDNQNSCADHRFRGASFPMLAANVRYAGTNRTILPATWVKTFKDGAKVGFIGMTLKDTPAIVSQAGIRGLEFTDEVATANALVPGLRKRGVKAIVVLVHQGGSPATTTYTAEHGTYAVAPPYDATCSTQTRDGVKGAQLAGDSPILDISRRLDPQIDMVVSGHTHQPYVCSVADPAGQRRLVTSASSFGRLFTETNLTYDLRRGDIDRAEVRGSNLVVTRDVPKDARQTSIIATYGDKVRAIADKVIGQVSSSPLPRPAADVETSLGRLIADAQAADATVVSNGRAPQVAFMNPGGIRSDLTASANGDVTYAQAFAVQPFNNYVVSMDLTGAQVLAVLEQQFSGANASFPKVLQVSKGLTYSYSLSAAPGAKVDPASVRIDGVALDPAATYRVAANSFLSDGGDGFAAFATGTNKLIGGLDIDSFAAYLTAASPYAPVAVDRITQTP